MTVKIPITGCDVQPLHFVCRECGEHAKADEDSCCVHCGADCWVGVCKCETPNAAVHRRGPEDK